MSTNEETAQNGNATGESEQRRLVEQWREAADDTGGLRVDEATRGAIFDLCADQLEAVLDGDWTPRDTGADQQ